jgi:hypothetical protein
MLVRTYTWSVCYVISGHQEHIPSSMKRQTTSQDSQDTGLLKQKVTVKCLHRTYFTAS